MKRGPEKTPGEKLAHKVWDTLAQGLGFPTRPWVDPSDPKERADADRAAHLVAEQVRVELELARSGRGVLAETRKRRRATEAAMRSFGDVHPLEALATANGVPAFIERAEVLARFLDLERASTLHHIAGQAEAEALAIGEVLVAADPVDADWFARWRAAAQDARSQTMLRFWARALVRETCQPGTLSIGALDLMGKLSRGDTAILKRVAPFIIKGQIFWHMSADAPCPRPSIDDLVDLAELAVVIGVEYPFELTAQLLSMQTDRFFHILDAGHKCLVVEHDDPTRVIRYPVLSISRIGMQVLALDPQPVDIGHLRALGLYLKQAGFSVSLGSWTMVDASTGRVTGAEVF